MPHISYYSQCGNKYNKYAYVWSVDGDTGDGRDSLLTNSMQTYGGRRWYRRSWQFTDQLDANLWSVDGETDCRDSLLTNSMQNIGE